MSYSRALAIAAVGAFAVSLFLPAVNNMWGTMTVFFGAAALLFDPPWFIVWLANPFFFAAAWMVFKERAPVARRLVAVLALACATYGLMTHSWVIEDTGLPQIMTIQVGYWVWLSAMALITLSTFSPHTVHAANTSGVHHSA